VFGTLTFCRPQRRSRSPPRRRYWKDLYIIHDVSCVELKWAVWFLFVQLWMLFPILMQLPSDKIHIGCWGILSYIICWMLLTQKFMMVYGVLTYLYCTVVTCLV